MSVHDTDLATMDRDQLICELIKLRAAVRDRHYTSDCKHLLPEYKVPKPPFDVPELYETEED